ncbi:energy transducer TonB [Sphingomonas pituitosa]|uniref:energy transducer TonB n=1 Tax=Sphingomonas pituitosa TaxID=99597 RepID=UPI001471DEB7|nr:energy transducer TonB [Sphingomonas pituitosa]
MKVLEYARGEAPREKSLSSSGLGDGQPPARYQPSRRPRWFSLGLIVAIHVGGFFALDYLDVGIVRQLPAPPLVVNLLPLDPPPPAPVVLPTEKVVVRPAEPKRVVAPPPIIAIPTAAVTIQTITKPEPIPPAPAKVGEAKPAPPRAADTLVNLNTRLLSAEPPRYPAESRRRREVGTVVLMVVVDEDGRVGTISISDSSGFERLDKAALSAVRRWRWTPTVIDGRPSQVRGLVRIPFELRETKP